ncbi:MAG: KamA family radical SAM protein [Planctomycetes bacterium]|nr:KamA family radical SAM protein [Planctomycetota bacterium]
MKVRYTRSVDGIPSIPEDQREEIRRVSARFPFRANDYYLSLVDWSDPEDPIRRLVVPDPAEMLEGGRLDASNEAAHTVAKGVQHKYPSTVLLLVNEVCGAYCRYCFRKRLFMDGNDETSLDVIEGLAYIRERPWITNVLLTGGDPLLLGTRRLLEIVEGVRSIPHVGIIRIGSKMPAFNPWRILDDPELLEGLSRFSTPRGRIYLMAHFDHPRELTEPAMEAMDRLLRAGVVAVNQCPLVRGINDDPETLAELFRRLSFIGVPPYYLFQGRPTAGNVPFQVPIAEGWRIFEAARSRVSGLAKRARFCMSHETGKVQIVGMDDARIYMRYHRSRDPADDGRFLVFRRDDAALWLDDLVPWEERGPGPARDLGEPTWAGSA